MIWRLTYCNKKGVEARIDIIKGNRTPVEIVQGSGDPFAMSYRLDKTDKSGHIMTSSADIEIFETETFNIDDLKTSNETELKVEYFEDNVLSWEGFILPDFFSREIGSPNIVRMTASDRLTALKGVTLSDLPSRISLRSLIELCLAETGLSLGLVSQVQINQGSTNILDSEILSQRLTDVRGRSISCYDILMSIMVGTNSTIRQRAGQWQVYNKLEHELRTPTIFFDKVERGAIRTIQPVASSVGIYQEFGGNKMYPQNYDFSNGLTWWTTVNGFVATINSKEVIGYTGGASNFVPIYGDSIETNSVINKNASFSTSSSPYLKSENIGVSYPDNDSVNVTVEVNATGVGSFITNSFVEFAIIATNTVTSKTLSLSNAGIFETMTNTPHIHRIKFPTVTSFYNASTGSLQVKGVLIAGNENLGDYDIHVRIYGSGESRTSFINSATIKFSVGGDNPKGNLYKTTQGSNFTKQHDIETVIFGDYIRGGINGHFYYYPIDETSNLYLPNGELSSPIWKTFFDTTERPLLHHVSRQKSRLFSVAHDILKANINVDSFDPLAVFQDCKGGKYVVVSASFDFLRAEVDVELEQIAYDNAILKRDFIYSYFGEGEDTIKSIGGIAGGGGTGGGGGGGMTNDQVAILNDVAKLAHLHENKEIIDQITQDMVDNASHEIVISTDTETELTDENILSSLRVLLEIAKNNETFLEDLKERFLSKIEPDTAQKLITFIEGIEVGAFTTGALGAGAAIKMIDGTSYAEVDNLTVRQKATFRELIIESLKHIGGQLVLTPARMKCVRVVEEDTFYKCYFDTGDGEVTNEFVAGDYARCQVFTGSGTKFYWRLVTLVGEDWINLSKTSAAVGSDVPEAGDDITQLGNATDTERQSAIILSTVGIDAPSWKQYSGINSFSLEGKETTVFSKLGNRISGETVFTSGGANLDNYLDGVAQDILDALQAAQDADDKAQQAIEDAEADVATINAEIGRLQDQIDGKVSNWYYAYSPTLSNYPASDWTTNEIKDSHIGDTFTNTEPAPAENAGKSWRFIKDGSTYSWIVISDSDALKALQEASKAQATADGKSTTYLFQPTKYKLGDMWVLNDDHTINGTAYKQGDLLTATQDSETFVQAHWLKRVRYTDDTAIDNLEIGGRNLTPNFSTWGSSNASRVLSNNNNTVILSPVNASSNAGTTSPNIRRIGNYTISINVKTSGLTTIYMDGRGTMLKTSHESLRSGIYYNLPSGFNERIIIYCNTDVELDANWYIGIASASETKSVELSYPKLEKGNKATDWTPAPEDVEANIATAKADAEQAAKDHADIKAEAERVLAEAYADGIVSDEEQARIDDVNDKLATAKAYAEAQDALLKTQQEAYADGKISTAEQAAIDAAKDYADLKKTEAQAYADGIVSDEEARAIADALAKFNASKAHAETLVDNIEIGGRNLLLGSAERIKGLGTNRIGFTVSNNLKAETYTISFDYNILEDNNTTPITEFLLYSNNTIDRTPIISGLQGHISFTFTVSPARVNPALYIYGGTNAAEGSNTHIVFSRVKLEKGNKATDWTPAPEDVQAEIDGLGGYMEGAFQDSVIDKAEAKAIGEHLKTINDRYVTDNAVYNNLIANPFLMAGTVRTTLQNVMQNIYRRDKPLLDTAINNIVINKTVTTPLRTAFNTAFTNYRLAITSFQTAVEDARKAIEEQRVDNIEIGGRNLYSNSLTTIETHGVVSFSRNTTSVPNGFSAIGQSTYGGYIQLNGVLKGDGYHTISFEVRGSQSINVGVRVHIPEHEVHVGNINSNNLNTYSGRKSVTFNITDYSEANNWIRLYLPWANVYIKDVQIEKGTKATDWTPAPEDTESELLESQGYMKARYIRDYLNGSSANAINHWVQITALNKAGTNIALNKTVTSNITTGNLDRITNGNMDVMNYASASEGNQYVQIDLGQVYYDIDNITAYHYWTDNREYNGTKTQISEDGITWKTIFDSAVSGTYKETSGGKVHTTKLTDLVDKATQEAADAAAKAADAQAKANKSAAITDQFSGFNGGLATAVIMEMREPSTTARGDATGFISGMKGDGTLPFLGAGRATSNGVYADAIAGTAKAIIRHDGTVKFTDAEITGIINALTGEIGNFNIQDGELKSSYSKSKSIWDYSKFPAVYVGERTVSGEVTVSVDAVELKETFNYQGIPTTTNTRITPDGVSVKSTTGVLLDTTKAELVDGRLSIEVSNTQTGVSSKVEIFSDGIYFDGQKFTGGEGGSDYVHPATHTASMITAGTLQGIVKANNNTSYTTKQVRNMILSTNDANSSQMANGDIWIKYE